MKVGILTCAAKEEWYIKACVKQFRQVKYPGIEVDHLVMVSRYTWTGRSIGDDSTAAIAQKAGARVIRGDWDEEDLQRRCGLELLKDKDWILIVDADEYYTQEAIVAIFTHLKDATEKVYKSAAIHVYWKDWNTVALPSYGLHGPPVLAMRPQVRFSHIRDVEGQFGYFPENVVTYHLSYCRTDEEVWAKIKSWGHAHEIIPGWFEEVWKKWVPGMRNFHPTAPHVFEEAAYLPLPQEIKDLLEWEKTNE